MASGQASHRLVWQPDEHQERDENSPVLSAQFDNFVNEALVDQACVFIEGKCLSLDGIMLTKDVVHHLEFDFSDQLAGNREPSSDFQIEPVGKVFIKEFGSFQMVGLAPNVTNYNGTENQQKTQEAVREREERHD